MTVGRTMTAFGLCSVCTLWSAQAQDTQTVQLGNYQLTVSHQRTPDIIDRDHEKIVRCNSGTKREFFFKDETVRTITMTDNLRTKLVIETEGKIGAEGIVGEIALALRAGVEAESGIRLEEGRSLTLTDIATEVVTPLQCYDQHVRLVYDQERYVATGTEPGRLYGRNPIDGFTVIKQSGFRFDILAKLNESCHKCEVGKGLQPVRNENGQELFAGVRAKNYSYVVPLYWGPSAKIIYPFDQLPDYVRNELKETASDIPSVGRMAVRAQTGAFAEAASAAK